MESITNTKYTFELNGKTISDMVKIFGHNVLSYGKATRVFFSPEDEKIINVEYTCQPAIKLTFEFRGDDHVVIYDNNMRRIASCSVYDSHDHTARERVQRMVMDAFERRIFLD